jgi:hypothetical protein
VHFHQDIGNSATRVSKALCHNRLISASVVVGAKPFVGTAAHARTASRRSGPARQYQPDLRMQIL